MKFLNNIKNANNDKIEVQGHTHISSDIIDVVSIPKPNSLLLLNSSSKLPTDITGDAGTVGGKTIAQLNPAGTVLFYANSTPPTGYLKANGALVSRITYADLFAAIGTRYGVGNGSTTFALPDLRGEFIRGFDDGRGVDVDRVIGSSQAQDIQPHTHSTYYTASKGSPYLYPLSSQMGKNSPALAGATSSTGTLETRPRNISLLAVIKF